MDLLQVLSSLHFVVNLVLAARHFSGDLRFNMNSSANSSSCPFAPLNQTCYSVYDPDSSFSLDVLFVNPGSLTCPSPRKILLVLFAYNLVTFIITVIAKLVRWLSSVRHWYGEVAEKPRNICILVPTGSLIIHVCFTIASGYILAAGGSPNSAGHATLIVFWFARPLPTLLLLPLIVWEPAEATELFVADFVYRLVAVGAFCIAAHATSILSLPLDAFIGGYNAHPYLAIIKAGAALGILAFLGSLLFVVPHILGCTRDLLWTNWKQSWRFTVFFLFGAHVVHTIASWLLWAGLVFAVPEGFCPSSNTLGKLAVVVLFAAIIDNLWQGFAILLAIGDEDRCPRWILAMGRGLDGLFGGKDNDN